MNRVIAGAKYSYVLQDGEDWRVYGDGILVVHPDRPPKLIHSDGRIEELTLTSAEWGQSGLGNDRRGVDRGEEGVGP